MKQLLFICMLFLAFNSISQSGNDTIVHEISPSAHKTLLNKQFRLVAGENATSNFGNFAGLDLSETKKVIFSPTFTLDTGNLLAFKIGGGYSDGISDLFEDSKLTSNIFFGADYHFLPRKEKRMRRVEVTYDLYDLLEFQDKKDAAFDSYQKDRVAIQNDETRTNLIDSLEKKLRSLNNQDIILRETLKKIKDSANWNNPNRTQEKTIDLYEDSLRTTAVELSIVKQNLERNSQPDTTWNKRAANIRYKKYIKEIAPYKDINLPVYGFKFGWFSVGGGVRKDAFKLYDSTRVYGSRILDESFISAQARLKYSFFSWADINGKNHSTYYWSIGITYNYRSNYSDLSSEEITQTDSFGSDSTTQLDKVEKSDVYFGNYKAYIDELVFNGEIYWFFLPQKTFALHGFTDLSFVSHGNTTFKLGAGIFVPFKGKDDEKSIVNAELYGSLSTGPEEGKIGLRFSFPINFNPKQKKNE